MEIKNERRAYGYLKYKGPVEEFNGNKFRAFSIRHVRKTGTRYRVTDYGFSASKGALESLRLIEINTMVHVKFEIKSKEATIKIAGKEKLIFKTSLRALDIFSYDEKEKAPEWIWKLDDYMLIKDTQEIKKLFPEPPDILKKMKSNPEHHEAHINEFTDVSTFKPKEVETAPDSEDQFPDRPSDADDLPF